MSIKYGLKLLFKAKMTIELNSSIFSSIKKYDPFPSLPLLSIKYLSK